MQVFPNHEELPSWKVIASFRINSRHWLGHPRCWHLRRCCESSTWLIRPCVSCELAPSLQHIRTWLDTRTMRAGGWLHPMQWASRGTGSSSSPSSSWLGCQLSWLSVTPLAPKMRDPIWRKLQRRLFESLRSPSIKSLWTILLPLLMLWRKVQMETVRAGWSSRNWKVLWTPSTPEEAVKSSSTKRNRCQTSSKEAESHQPGTKTPLQTLVKSAAWSLPEKTEASRKQETTFLFTLHITTLGLSMPRRLSSRL